MNNSRQKLFLISLFVGILVVIIVSGLILSLTDGFNYQEPPIRQTITAIVALNQTTEAQLHQTQTASFYWGHPVTISPTPNPFPYDPTLYLQRRHEEDLLTTAAGPTAWHIFFVTETALVATYQGTILPTFTAIPYTADMSPTALPPPSRTPTRTPTLCPHSDIICPGGNATLSPAQKVMVLMASARAPEFGQLAQTATALAVTPSPSPTATSMSSVHNSNCAFSWAHQDLPEIAGTVQAAFDAAGVQSIKDTRADAYGENCVTADGSVSYFAAMTTDFYLNATVSNLTDMDALAAIVKTAYQTLTTLKADLPARPSYLDITFTAGSKTKHFRTMFDQLRPAIEAGKSGAELLAVGGVR